MTCAEARRYLDAIVLGGGAGWRGRAARRHLDACADCRAEAARIQRMDEQIRHDLRDLHAPAGLWERIDHEIARTTSAATRPALGSRRAGVWGVGLAGVVLAVGLWSVRRPMSLAPIGPDAPHAVATRQIPTGDNATEQYLLASWRDPLADRVALATRYAMVAGSEAEVRR